MQACAGCRLQLWRSCFCSFSCPGLCTQQLHQHCMPPPRMDRVPQVHCCCTAQYCTEMHIHSTCTLPLFAEEAGGHHGAVGWLWVFMEARSSLCSASTCRERGSSSPCSCQQQRRQKCTCTHTWGTARCMCALRQCLCSKCGHDAAICQPCTAGLWLYPAYADCRGSAGSRGRRCMLRSGCQLIRPSSPPTCSAKLFLLPSPTPPDAGATLSVRGTPGPHLLLPPRLAGPAGLGPSAAAQAGAPRASSSSSSEPVQLLWRGPSPDTQNTSSSCHHPTHPSAPPAPMHVQQSCQQACKWVTVQWWTMLLSNALLLHTRAGGMHKTYNSRGLCVQHAAASGGGLQASCGCSTSCTPCSWFVGGSPDPCRVLTC
jgi:hypothetical protein